LSTRERQIGERSGGAARISRVVVRITNRAFADLSKSAAAKRSNADRKIGEAVARIVLSAASWREPINLSTDSELSIVAVTQAG
jgi:hypothetical protein